MLNSVRRAEAIATGVGLATFGIGALLAAAPRASARAAGIRDSPTRPLTMVGVLDLAIALGLLAGRPRWPWLAARAAANPPALYFTLLGHQHGATRLYVAAAVIGCATVADLQACRTLYSAGR